MLPELLTIDEFCKLTNTGKTRAYAEINAGRLIAKKYGRCTRIPRTAMMEWIKSLPSYATEEAEA